MKRRNQNLQITILSITSMSLLIILLLSICSKLIGSIARTFVYLTGLVSLFITIAAVILFIVFVMYVIIGGRRKRCKFGKRGYINNNLILEYQISIVCTLSVISVFLFLVTRFIR